MIAPFSLSNVLTVLVAVLCLWTINSQSSGGVVKLWRLAVPPCLAAAQALVLLAGVFDATMTHDGEWLVAMILGGLFGRAKGWLMAVEIDRTWRLIRLPRTVDGVVAGFLLVVVALVDSAGAAMETPVVMPQYVAAAAAMLAGYLSCRALAMSVRAERSPHVELVSPDRG